MNGVNPIIQKIIGADQGTYVLFYVPECPYCQNALGLLRAKSLPYKAYNINNINGNMNRLLKVLGTNSVLTGYNTYHTTKPLIFVNGQFVGGYDDLVRYVGAQLGSQLTYPGY